ncbi:hypothetical protein ACHAQJ_004234 [Trichoderma viride]
MSSNTEGPPAPPQPLLLQSQHLLSPCESPRPTNECSETLGSSGGPTDKLELSGDCTLPDEEHDNPGSLVRLMAPVYEALRAEPSLFVDENTMEDSQAVVDSNAINDSYAINDSHTVEGNHPMEEGQVTPHAPETDMDSDEDTLPSIDELFEQDMAKRLSQAITEESDKSEDNCDTEEDEGSNYEDDSRISSNDDCEHEGLRANGTSTAKKGGKKPRRKIALTAREYVARLHEDEDRKYARKMKQQEGKKPVAKRSRKRKLVEDDAGSFKALKTANGGSLLRSNDCSQSSNDHPLLPMEPIKARTHAEQFAQLTASIPHNCDTRRKTTQKQDLREAASLFGYKRVEAQNGSWKLKGMQTGMRCHQITAVAWMVKRELARMEPFGGILADAMGMGKTIMSLACIIGNPADDEQIGRFCQATLVVVPSKTIALQWEEEARKHCNEPYKNKVFVYDRQRGDLVGRCKESFIVIATYRELISQYPDKVVLRKLYEKYDSDDISIQRELDKIVGPLFRVNWYRIILDEAHAIKNAESSTTKACCALFGKYRWALSGTPLANSSDGHQIINLPERKATELWIPISMEEQFIVDAVSEHYEKKKARLCSGLIELEDLMEDLKDMEDMEDVEETEAVAEIEDVDETEEEQGDKNRHRQSTPIKPSQRKGVNLLGRMSQMSKRQSTSHVFCIEALLRQRFSTEELDKLTCAFEKIGSKRTILEQMQLGVKEDDEILKYLKGLQILQQREETFLGKYFDMLPFLNILREESRVRDVTCLLCDEAKPPVDPMHSATTCPNEGCDKKLGMGDDIRTIQTVMKKAEAKGSGYSEPAKDSTNVSVRKNDERNGLFVASTFCEDIPILPSTKLTAAAAVVLTWMHEAPDDKILIFTQFVGSLKMLGLMLQSLNIGFVYYYGGLTSQQKSRALETIRTNDDIKVMVATLKCGGQSLNLTAANRVIIIDPWWNKTAEKQAFGRVVRIGQEKVTHLVNILTKEPIDCRISNIQEKKAKDVDRTLQDDGHTPLPVSELELEKAFFRKKCENEEKKAAKVKAAKTAAAKTAKKKRF